MPKGDKFIELRNYFEESGKSEIRLTFIEIEKIIGRKLCKSAYMYKAYWNIADTHTFPIAWLQAGYELKSLDLNEKVVIFIKIKAKNE